ncbi:MAG: Copper transport outer membrane protein MctB [Jatrophihabitans sp.]|nr:Copper transport outer membrane protein MctB [Jatrophihabitans sp.]
MISFRYHLVSIVAIFLALALGIVVGTTALNGPITKDLRNQVNDLKKQRDGLTTQVKALQGQVDDASQFASTYGSQLVAKTLTGQSVIVVSMPGTSSAMQDGISKQISAAGGKIGGQVTLTKDYLDPRRGSGISSLATGPAHPIAWTAPETSDAGQLGGSLLAYVLLGKGQQTDLTQVLGGFAELHMVTVAGGSVTPSTSVVVLGTGTLPAKDYGGAAELALVGALAHGGAKVVVAGDVASAKAGGLVALVRDSATTRSGVSSVDDANSAFGQVSSVLALSAAMKGQQGHYGTEQGADALFPSPTK